MPDDPSSSPYKKAAPSLVRSWRRQGFTGLPKSTSSGRRFESSRPSSPVSRTGTLF